MSFAGASPAPTPSPSARTTPTTSPEAPPTGQDSGSGSTAVVAGVLSAFAGAALITLAVTLRWRRGASRKTTRPPKVSPTHDGGNVEQGRKEPLGFRSCPAGFATGDGGKRPSHNKRSTPLHRRLPTEADGVGGGRLTPPPAPAPLDARTESRNGHAESAHVAGDRGTERPGGDATFGAAEHMLAPASSNGSACAPSTWSAERAELAQRHEREHGMGAGCDAGDPDPIPHEAPGSWLGTSLAADRQTWAGGIGLGHAVLAAAQELAHQCQIPGVSEAATAVCIMANLVTNNRENVGASESRLRQCRTVLMALKRAANVADKVGLRETPFCCSFWVLLVHALLGELGSLTARCSALFTDIATVTLRSSVGLNLSRVQGGDTIGEVAQGMIEEVHEAISDLVQLIKTYQSKNKLSRLFMSTLFKRRQEELDAVVDRAIMRLQVSGAPRSSCPHGTAVVFPRCCTRYQQQVRKAFRAPAIGVLRICLRFRHCRGLWFADPPSDGSRARCSHADMSARHGLADS